MNLCSCAYYKDEALHRIVRIIMTEQAKGVFSAAEYEKDGKHHILLGATGSVATIKLPLIARALSTHHERLSIRIVVTPAAAQFLNSQSPEQPALQSLLDLPGVEGIYVDADEWSEPWIRGGRILHIELRRWAHLFLIAPLSANSLAKIVGGMSDGLLTSVVRAWDPGSSAADANLQVRRRRILVAPAMNTAMWRHPITSKQIKVLEDEWGSPGALTKTESEETSHEEPRGWFTVLRPISKELACGDVGDGAMLEWSELVRSVEQYFSLPLSAEK